MIDGHKYSHTHWGVIERQRRCIKVHIYLSEPQLADTKNKFTEYKYIYKLVVDSEVSSPVCVKDAYGIVWSGP